MSMPCAVEMDLARYQRQIDREAEYDARIERRAAVLEKLPVKELISIARKDIGEEIESLIGLIAQHEIESEDAQFEMKFDCDDGARA